MPAETHPEVVNKHTFLSPEVRVVEASAGSGKTYALAKRYIQLLLNPQIHFEHIPIRSILAITFTNKASFEMKVRILEYLKQLSLGQISDLQARDILEPIGLSLPEAKERAVQVIENIIHNYNFFQVQTIDSFINALLSGCSFKINLSANFKIKTNSYEYLQHAFDQLLDEASTDKTVYDLFTNFLHYYLYLENRSGWFPKDDALSIVETLFAQMNTYGLDFRTHAIAPNDLIKRKRNILKRVNEFKESLPDKIHKGFESSLNSFLEKNTQGFDVDSVSDYFEREHLPVRKGAEISPNVIQSWKSIRRELTQLCEDEAYSLFNSYIDIYQELMERFYHLTTKDDILFLSELNKRAKSLFDEDRITVEELYYRLATRFRHYLIDEFQDTSKLQWHNLEKMAEEALSTGGTLFYVGDRKQAIYGFRGGDVGLFDSLKQSFQAFNVVVDQLTTNWRSQKAIVQFNNHIFSLDNLKSFLIQKQNYEDEKNKRHAVAFSPTDIDELGKVFAAAQQTPLEANNQGYVHIEYVDMDKKEERNNFIQTELIARLRELQTRFDFSQIALLTRTNREVEELTNWLMAEGIPVDSERTSNVKENTLIEELVVFLKFLNSPIDNVSFTQFILGEIFTQAAGLTPETMQTFVFQLRDRLKNEKNFYVYTEFRAQFPDLWSNYLDEFFRNVGLYPLYELVISIYNKLRCLENFKEYQGFFMHFLELIKTQEDDCRDISSFLDYFDNLVGDDSYVDITDSDTIKILTVHKAKGLEFPVVIVPFLGMDVQVGTSMENQPNYVIQQQDDHIKFLRLKNKYYGFSDELYQLYALEYKKLFVNELNNVYVALTRAKYELYAFVPKKYGNTFNFMRFLIPESIYKIGQTIQYPNVQKRSENITRLNVSNYHDWIEYLKDEFLSYDQIKNREQRRKGEVVHFILSFFGNLANESKEDVLKKAEAELLVRYPRESFAEYQEGVNRLLGHKNLKKFFYLTSGTVQTEVEVVTELGNTKRMDRLIIRRKEVIVVDYKSSPVEDDSYEQQVQEYVQILKSIYSDKIVEGYLVYLDTLEVKQVNG